MKQQMRTQFQLMRSVLGLAILVAIGCSKSTTSPVGVSGVNKTGTYNLTGVSCFNSADLATVTDSATISGVTEVLTITGNDYVETITDSDCSVEVSGRIVFDSSLSYTKTRTSISIVDPSCVVNYVINGGGISPGIIDQLFTRGTGVTDEGYWLAFGTDYLGLIEDPLNPKFQLTGKVCYSTYQKQ